VRATTRRRVLEIVEKTGYRPNPLISAAMVQRRSPAHLACSATIAYLNCYTEQALWQSSPWQSRFYEGARQRADELGFALEEFRLFARSMTPRRMERILQTRGISGLIIGSFQCAHAHLSLNWSVFAPVAQGFSLIRPLLHRVANDYSDSMGLALRALRRRGYRRIGLVISPKIDARCRYGFSAGLHIYQRHVARADVIPLLGADFTKPDLFESWFGRHRPQAILTPHLLALDVIRELGMRIPEDTGLAHTDWQPSYAEWAGVDHRVEHAGRAATDTVVTQLFSNQRGLPEAPAATLTRGAWVDGPSVRTIDVPATMPRQPKSVTIRTKDD
jgi:DNA-binding LacI/PurR family transcriptional regulator